MLQKVFVCNVFCRMRTYVSVAAFHACCPAHVTDRDVFARIARTLYHDALRG